MPMNNDMSDTELSEATSRPKGLKTLGIVVVSTTIATVIAVWALMAYFFPSEFKPVSLNPKEKQILNAKIEQLDSGQKSRLIQQQQAQSTGQKPLAPEAYREDASQREIVLSEKELNALLAMNTDLARKLAIDLSDDLASAKLLLPLDQDLPLVGGKTLKVTAGLQLGSAGGKPIVALKGISIWGVPLPNAWLGNLKNVDLVQEFGAKEGFWKTFAAGIDEIKVKEGRLRVKLKQ